MTVITVNKQDLIVVLKENRDQHHEEYKEAYAGYKQLCIEALEERLGEIKNGEKINMYFTDLNSEPEDHTEDYQNVIDMLEVGQDTEIKLTIGDYMKYYKNDWDWRRHWGMSNASYINKFKSM